MSNAVVIAEPSAVPPLANDIPARIRAGFQFIDYTREITKQYGESIGSDYCYPKGRDLNKLEQATYNSVLQMLNLYFLGEQDHEPNCDSRRHNGVGVDSDNQSRQ